MDNPRRTKVKAYGNMSPKEEAAMKRHCDDWIAVAKRTKAIVPAKIIPAIREIYAASGFRQTPEVVIAPSPLAAAYIYGAASAHYVRAEYGKVGDPIGAYIAKHGQPADRMRSRSLDPAAKIVSEGTRTLGFNPWAEKAERPDYRRSRQTLAEKINGLLQTALMPNWRNVIHGVSDAMQADLSNVAKLQAKAAISKTNDAAYSVFYAVAQACVLDLRDFNFRLPRTDIPVGAGVAAAVKAGLDYQISESLERRYAEAAVAFEGDNLAIECARNWHYATHGGNLWCAQEAFIAAARDVIGLDVQPQFDAFAPWETAAREGGIRLMHERFCVVSDFPEFIHLDPQSRSHCADGPSIGFRDGWSLYHWHGVPVPGRWIEEPESLSAHEALTWDNVEQRRAACEIIGWAKILKDLSAKVIDEDGDPQIGTLVEVELPGMDESPLEGFRKIKARFVRVLCGTGREFALCVPPDTQTAIEAQAWLVGLTLEEFVKPEVRA